MLMLNNGQRLETAADGHSLKVSEFEAYATQVGSTALVTGVRPGLKSAAIEAHAQAPVTPEQGWELALDRQGGDAAVAVGREHQGVGHDVSAEYTADPPPA